MDSSISPALVANTENRVLLKWLPLVIVPPENQRLVKALGIHVLRVCFHNSLVTRCPHSLQRRTVSLIPLRVKTPLQKGMTEVTKQIQNDLEIIGSMENSNAGLMEIDGWTGGQIKIDTFVNFVIFPAAEREHALSDWKGVSIVKVQRDAERCEVVEMGNE